MREECERAAVEFAETCRELFLKCGGAVVVVGISGGDDEPRAVEYSAMIAASDAFHIVRIAANEAEAHNYVAAVDGVVH